VSGDGPPSIGIRLLDPRLRGWGFPRWGSAAAAGLDLQACLDAPLTLAPQAPPVLIAAGFCVRIGDPDWCGLIFPRSGLGHRDGLVLGNTVGVIDADYEGPVMISAWNRNPIAGDAPAVTIEPGDRIAQLVLTRVTRPALTVTEAFGEAEAPPEGGSGRGRGGFGSTGVR
jgi:dUTP pyrophosphatase